MSRTKRRDHQKAGRAGSKASLSLARVPDQPLPVDLTVRSVVARQLRLPPDDLTDDLHLRTDLGLDDDLVPGLLTAMGEALDVRFPDDFFDGVSTYAQLTTAVRVSLSPL